MMPKPGEAETQTSTTEEPALAPVTEAVAVDDTAAAEQEDAEAKERKRWKRTLIVVGNHRVASDEKRPVIVVEARTVDAKGAKVLKVDGYPAKADLYYRTDEAVQFPDDATVLTLGQNVEQSLFAGFSPHPRYVHVGPASPIYAAANLAYQRGAEQIEIVGATAEEKEKLQPWFDELVTTGGPAPVEGAHDVRFPAKVKIDLT